MALRGVGHRLGREPARGLDGVGSPVWPLAVGVVLSAKGFSGHTLAEDRLALALGAYRMGHFLLDLIDVPAWAAADETRGWAPVWDLVFRAHANAVVIHGGEVPGRRGTFRARRVGPGWIGRLVKRGVSPMATGTSHAIAAMSPSSK